uniref:Uncharacterized protein n=1 Tax=Globisporangium ultimum (strain ATCC 200006 / CBS 805.95 / DAOM BR144) TaxID=431595 RepID=K3WKY0_GLOUD
MAYEARATATEKKKNEPSKEKKKRVDGTKNGQQLRWRWSS